VANILVEEGGKEEKKKLSGEGASRTGKKIGLRFRGGGGDVAQLELETSTSGRSRFKISGQRPGKLRESQG
jgi:hypothetical protein